VSNEYARGRRKKGKAICIRIAKSGAAVTDCGPRGFFRPSRLGKGVPWRLVSVHSTPWGAPLHGQGLEAKNGLYLHGDVIKKEPEKVVGGIMRRKKRDYNCMATFFPFRNVVAKK
jgi:hypothetical protein